MVTTVDSDREESITVLFPKTSFSEGSFKWLQRSLWQKARSHCWLVRNMQAACPRVVKYCNVLQALCPLVALHFLALREKRRWGERASVKGSEHLLDVFQN